MQNGWISLYKKNKPGFGTAGIFLITVLSLFVGGGWNADVTAQSMVQTHTEKDFFYSNGRQHPVSVALDSIGLWAGENVSRGEIKEMAASLGMTLTGEFPGNIYVLRLEKSMPRPELVRTAREVKKKLGKMVFQTGLVVTPVGAEIPLIASDEFIVQFSDNVNDAHIKELLEKNALRVVRVNPFTRGQYLLRVTERSGTDALTMANRIHENPFTVFSHPNFVAVVDERQFIPNDPLFGNQWHHRNTGQSAGTVDADIDSDLAWAISRGDAGVVIAVIDSGFDITHPDLTPNLWTNPGEIAGNGIDDDGNTFIDDTLGWDFTPCAAGSPAGCGDNNPTGGSHGTSVAGAAAARGNNTLGVTGSCPNCSLMLIRRGGTVFTHGLSFDYARRMGADIITNSWGYTIGTPATAVVTTAINNAAGAGSVIFFAMNNPNVNDCTGTTPDISSLADVIAVSRSTNRDRFDFSGFGNCMDLLAPSAGCATVSSGRGTLSAATTDVQGTAGYNNGGSCGCGSVEPSPPPANARDYTLCFGGTSFAAPLTAGAAGLLLSVNPGLTRVQVQRLLQDTADKIEDSTGRYADNNGFSSPATGQATHGWGRLNAFEAVRIAASADNGGKDGVDIFLRDNRLDWGNTEQPSNTLFEPVRGFIGHWRSMDIKVDAPPYQPVPTAATFDAFVDEKPSAVAGNVNRVYVRVRNRGPVTAGSVTVKLHWTQFGTALPALPADFWTAFPADSAFTADWHPIQCGSSTSTVCSISNLNYSGASIAATAADAAQIVQFNFPAPPVDPTKPNHFCLLAMIDSPQDRILPKSRAVIPNDFVVDILTPTDNNVTHRNYHNLRTSTRWSFKEKFFVRNGFDDTLKAVLRLEAPKGWKIELDKLGFDRPFRLKPRQRILVTVKAVLPGLNREGEVTIIQERTDGKPFKVMGGLTLGFKGEAEKPVIEPGGSMLTPYLTGTYDLRNGADAILHVVNPTGGYLRVAAAFFDDDEHPLACVMEVLSPGDLWEIEVRKYVDEGRFGVVNLVSLHEKELTPAPGIVGFQRHMFKEVGGVSEAALRPVPAEILEKVFDYIMKACEL